jgi:hypothetical protein
MGRTAWIPCAELFAGWNKTKAAVQARINAVRIAALLYIMTAWLAAEPIFPDTDALHCPTVVEKGMLF